MPRLVRIITRLNLGGPARQIIAMTPHLAEAGYETHVLFGDAPPEEGDLELEFAAAGARMHRIPDLVREFSMRRDRRAVRQLRHHLAELAPDLVHTHMAKAGWLGRRACRQRRIRPLIHTFHGHLLSGYFGRVLTRVYANIERRLARRTDRLVCVSTATLEELIHAEVIPAERSGVIRPGIRCADFEQVAREPFTGNGSPTLLFVGRLVPVKRPERFLELVAALRGAGREVRALVLGDGPLRPALEARARHADIADAVEFLGLERHTPPVIERADLLVSTSHNEGLPVAILEAFAAARPVVAMNVGGIGEAVSHGRDGLLVASGDELALRNAVEQMLDGPEEARVMGRRGRIKVRDRFSAQRLAGDHLALYRSALDVVPGDG